MVQDTVILPDEVIRQLDGLANSIDKIMDDMLTAGMEAVRPEVQKRLKNAITGEYATGELEKSAAVKKKKYKNGDVAKVLYFKGTSRKQKAKNGKVYKRAKPVRLNEIAAVLEYGRSDMAARAYMRPAFNAKAGDIARAMERVFDEETKKYQN